MSAAVDEALVEKAAAALAESGCIHEERGFDCTSGCRARAVLAAVLPDAQAKAWDRGASEALRMPPHLGYMLRNPYRDAAPPRSP